MAGFVEKRRPENGAGRRCTDGYCPLHSTHHGDIKTLKEDYKGLEKGKVSLKLFGIFITSATALTIAIGGIMIHGQRETAKSIVEIKTAQARIETQMDIHLENNGDRNSPGYHGE
jgi:hypothetical protein